MKFTVALTLATVAIASTVSDVVETAGKDIDAVKAAADAYKGDKTDLVSTADKLISDLKSGTSKVSSGDELSQTDTLALVSPVQALTKSGQELTDSLKARKSEVEKAGECKTVQEKISDISTNSKALIDAVTKKVPEALQSTAETLASGLTKVLADAESSYKDCKDSSSGGGDSTGTGSATATGTETGTGSATPTQTGGNTSAQPTGSQTAVPTGGASTDCPPGSSASATGTGGMKPTNTPPTVPNSAALFAPAGILAAVAAALAL